MQQIKAQNGGGGSGCVSNVVSPLFIRRKDSYFGRFGNILLNDKQREQEVSNNNSHLREEHSWLNNNSQERSFHDASPLIKEKQQQQRPPNRNGENRDLMIQTTFGSTACQAIGLKYCTPSLQFQSSPQSRMGIKTLATNPIKNDQKLFYNYSREHALNSESPIKIRQGDTGSYTYDWFKNKETPQKMVRNTKHSRHNTTIINQQRKKKQDDFIYDELDQVLEQKMGSLDLNTKKIPHDLKEKEYYSQQARKKSKNSKYIEKYHLDILSELSDLQEASQLNDRSKIKDEQRKTTKKDNHFACNPQGQQTFVDEFDLDEIFISSNYKELLIDLDQSDQYMQQKADSQLKHKRKRSKQKYDPQRNLTNSTVDHKTLAEKISLDSFTEYENELNIVLKQTSLKNPQIVVQQGTDYQESTKEYTFSAQASVNQANDGGSGTEFNSSQRLVQLIDQQNLDDPLRQSFFAQPDNFQRAELIGVNQSFGRNISRQTPLASNSTAQRSMQSQNQKQQNVSQATLSLADSEDPSVQTSKYASDSSQSNASVNNIVDFYNSQSRSTTQQQNEQQQQNSNGVHPLLQQSIPPRPSSRAMNRLTRYRDYTMQQLQMEEDNKGQNTRDSLHKIIQDRVIGKIGNPSPNN